MPQLSRARIVALAIVSVLCLTATLAAEPQVDTSLPDCGIQALIDAAASAGGSTVVLPAGRFPLGRSLVLKSGITLKGQGDAWNHHWNQVERIEGDTLHLAWPLTVSPAAGSSARRMHSLITAEGVENVGVEDLALEGFADERKPAGGLGVPGDSGNLVEGNLIEGNGLAGIEMMGGPKNHGNTVVGNTIESTASNPTQWVGIEERHAPSTKGQKNKADPTTGLVLVDESTFEGNRLSGHKTADIVIRGPTSKATGNEGRIVEERPQR